MRIFLSLFALLLVATACQNSTETSQQATAPEPPPPPTQPNIVLLVGDDQGYPYFGFMGADYVLTPNMDALAASGTVFTHGYVPENHCRPSLATLLTGILPIDYKKQQQAYYEEEKAKPAYQEMDDAAKTEWDANFDFNAMQYFQTLPRILAEEGYASFQGGKWWEYNYQNGGFSHGMTTGWTPEEQQDDDWFLEFMGGDGTDLARVTNQPAYDFLAEINDQPFFMWYAPSLPHYPFDAPETYYNLYADQEMTESAKRYYANCTWFDDAVGELVAHLKAHDLFENTLFVYVNDNGWEQNPDQEFVGDEMRYHNGGDKGKLSMYDQSFRTPIIFSWPGHIKSGAMKDDLIHSADIPATLLDYLGLPIPKDYHGLSYKQLIEGDDTELRSAILGDCHKVRWEGDMMGKDIEGYWIRSGEWFLSHEVQSNETRLHNILTDPFSNQNLAEEQPEVVNQLLEHIDTWKVGKGITQSELP